MGHALILLKCLHAFTLVEDALSDRLCGHVTAVSCSLVGSMCSDICSMRSLTEFKAAAQLDADQLTFTVFV